MHLESIKSPNDLRSLDEKELGVLAEEIRSEIVSVIDKTEENSNDTPEIPENNN